MAKTHIMICGNEPEQCNSVRELLSGHPEFEIAVQVCPPGDADPLKDQPLPDVLIAIPGKRSAELLQGGAAQRVPTIVIGSDSDVRAMREAMHAGARDYFSLPIPRVELLQALKLIGGEKGGGNGHADTPLGPLTAVINTKGGAGASMIALNLAHIAAVTSAKPVALLDLDVQFGALPLALDLDQGNTLLDALANAGQLDAMALQGHMAKHSSGVHVLSAMSDQLALPWEINTESLGRLLRLLRQSYQQVFADLPREVNPVTTTALSQAHRVVLVMQQSLAHVRNTKRMLHILTQDLAISPEHVIVVVNRYSDQHPVSLADIRETVRAPALVSIPNAFHEVSQSLNAGVPLMQADRHSGITKALHDLLDRITATAPAVDQQPPKHRSFRERIAHPFGG